MILPRQTKQITHHLKYTGEFRRQTDQNSISSFIKPFILNSWFRANVTQTNLSLTLVLVLDWGKHGTLARHQICNRVARKTLHRQKEWKPNPTSTFSPELCGKSSLMKPNGPIPLQRRQLNPSVVGTSSIVC